MYNIQNIHQRKTIGRYVNEHMKESLIPGVPEIASSESGYRRAVKSIAFLLCAAGFFYQSYVFIQSFRKYETTQNMRIEYPTKFMAPAVTFCDKNRIHRTHYCKGLPAECFWFNSSDDFCDNVPVLCNTVIFGIEGLLPAVPLNVNHSYNSSNEFLDAYGPQSPWDFFKIDERFQNLSVCQTEINGGIQRCKANDTMLVQVPTNGLPYKCITIYSLFGKPNREPREIRPSDGYFFWLWKHPEYYLVDKDDFPFYMSVHDPRSLVNPMAEGIVLHGGRKYTFSIRMKQRQALPPPYDSNCIDYVSKWKENGGRGPITKKDCLELCKIERMMKKHSCVGKNIMYPHRFPICSKPITISPKVVKECSSGCREACNAITYEIAAVNWRPINPVKPSIDNFIQVELKFNQLNIKRNFMEPKFQNIELFSYIGGFMGLWLGICLVTFIDFLETVTDITFFAAMKWKKRFLDRK